MGSHLFKSNVKPVGGMNLAARAVGSGAYAGRVAGGAAQKDIAAAQALYKAKAAKPNVRGSAYAKGPKI